MKISLSFIFAALIMVGGLSSASYAQNGKSNGKPKVWQVNKRQTNQQGRIYNGIGSGELTRRESARLGKEQYQINRMERRYRKSGDGLSARERVRLAREQNQASRHIYRQKHDDQDRPRN